MTDVLMREQAPLNDEQWEAIDRAVVETARSRLVGRRVLPVYGPLGAGIQTLFDDKYPVATTGNVDLFGTNGEEPIQPTARQPVALPLIYRDFVLHWRDIQAGQEVGLPLDIAPAVAAAEACARAEDNLIFNGNAYHAGLLTVEGRQTLARGDWDTEGQALADVLSAIEALGTDGFGPPYAVVMPPALYAKTLRPLGPTGMPELDRIRGLVGDRVYMTVAISDGIALVIATGAHNADLAIGQDLTAAYLDTVDLNHRFRVVESLVLRIRRAGAICTLERSNVG